MAFCGRLRASSAWSLLLKVYKGVEVGREAEEGREPVNGNISNGKDITSVAGYLVETQGLKLGRLKSNS